MKLQLTEKEVVDLYNKGLTMMSIAKLGGVSSYNTNIRPILIKNNIKIRNKGDSDRINRLHKIDSEYFNNIDTEEKAYWLGFIFADGCVKEHKTTLLLKDEEPIQQFKQAIKSEHKISKNSYFDKRTKKIYKSFSIQITSKRFSEPLRKMGIFHTSSKNYSFPEIKKELYNHFFRGIFDGDGYIGYVGNQKRISIIASQNILNKLQYILEKEHKIVKTKLQEVTKNHKEIMKMYLYADAIKFLNYIYKDSTEKTRLNRKYEIYESFIKNKL